MYTFLSTNRTSIGISILSVIILFTREECKEFPFLFFFSWEGRETELFFLCEFYALAFYASGHIPKYPRQGMPNMCSKYDLVYKFGSKSHVSVEENVKKLQL